MPFPVDQKYITATEIELNVKFPIEFKTRMINYNGGELVNRKFELQLYPFFDKSSKKRIRRTCNHIVLETRNLQEWNNFPKNTIAIGSDASGNQIVLMHNGDGNLEDKIFFWNHETGKTHAIAKNINTLDNSKLAKFKRDSRKDWFSFLRKHKN